MNASVPSINSFWPTKIHSLSILLLLSASCCNNIDKVKQQCDASPVFPHIGRLALRIRPSFDLASEDQIRNSK